MRKVGTAGTAKRNLRAVQVHVNRRRTRLDTRERPCLIAGVWRDVVQRVAKPVHDRLFRDFVYEVQYGALKGYQRRGRMPWFQRESTDPRAQRELEFFKSLELEGKVAYDIGSNIGTHAVMLHERVGPNGRVVAFEPDPTYASKILDLTELNELPRLYLHQVALGDQPGELELLVPDSKRVRMSATLAPTLKAIVSNRNIRRTVRVTVARLDDLVTDLDLPAPDFLKIDVEGFELEVLRGGPQTLARTHPLLFVEVHGVDAAAKIATTRALFQLLPGYAFEHFETGARVHAAGGSLPAGGHWVCRFES